MISLPEIIKEYNKKGYIFTDLAEVRSGKEATVYHTVGGDTLYALKIYTDPENRDFKNAGDYLEGKFIKSHSLRKGIAKGSKFAKKASHNNWIKREFALLKKLQDLDAGTPTVFDCGTSSILMEFIGDENGPASRLVDISLDTESAKEGFESILNFIRKALDAGIVHSDLSAYNILVWNDKLYVIDLPQAVDIRQSPNVEKLLKRDIDNVISYFKKYMEINVEEIYRSFNL